jgi:hypothetical protein
VIIYFKLPIFCNGGENQLREILGEEQEVIHPHELHKHVLGILRGCVLLLANSLIRFGHLLNLISIPIQGLLLATSRVH